MDINLKINKIDKLISLNIKKSHKYLKNNILGDEILIISENIKEVIYLCFNEIDYLMKMNNIDNFSSVLKKIIESSNILNNILINYINNLKKDNNNLNKQYYKASINDSNLGKYKNIENKFKNKIKKIDYIKEANLIFEKIDINDTNDNLNILNNIKNPLTLIHINKLFQEKLKSNIDNNESNIQDYLLNYQYWDLKEYNIPLLLKNIHFNLQNVSKKFNWKQLENNLKKSRLDDINFENLIILLIDIIKQKNKQLDIKSICKIRESLKNFDLYIGKDFKENNKEIQTNLDKNNIDEYESLLVEKTNIINKKIKELQNISNKYKYIELQYNNLKISHNDLKKYNYTVEFLENENDKILKKNIDLELNYNNLIYKLEQNNKNLWYYKNKINYLDNIIFKKNIEISNLYTSKKELIKNFIIDDSTFKSIENYDNQINLLIEKIKKEDIIFFEILKNKITSNFKNNINIRKKNLNKNYDKYKSNILYKNKSKNNNNNIFNNDKIIFEFNNKLKKINKNSLLKYINKFLNIINSDNNINNNFNKNTKIDINNISQNNYFIEKGTQTDIKLKNNVTILSKYIKNEDKAKFINNEDNSKFNKNKSLVEIKSIINISQKQLEVSFKKNVKFKDIKDQKLIKNSIIRKKKKKIFLSDFRLNGSKSILYIK